MKKILLVLTGGTIGSTVMKNVVGLTENSKYTLVSAYEKKYGRDVEFEIISPVCILSENLNTNIWETLFGVLLNTDLNKYSGVIVAHGTDTLSYTSAMTGFLLGYSNIPVVLTASGKPIGEKGSNGLENFRNAVCLIKQNITGVFTVYSDIYGTNNVYLATRLLEADRYNDNFLPFGNVPYGIIENEKFVKCENEINNFDLKPISKICDKINLKNKIMIINPYPGIDYNSINPEGCAAVLHTLYHSATAEEKGLKGFAEKCRTKNIDVYLCCFKSEALIYSSMKNILESNVIPLMNISSESAYAKLLIAYNAVENPTEFMRTNIYHETVRWGC